MAGEFESRTLADRGLREYFERNSVRPSATWPLPSWDLSGLTLTALYYSPDLDVARARLAVVRAGAITAGARPNPSFAFSPEFVANSGTLSPWILAFSFDIPIETLGKRGYRIDRARHLSEAAKLEMASTAWGVRSRLRAAMLDWWAADRRADIASRELALRENLVEALERRVEVGGASALDVGREHVARDQAELLVQGEQRRSREARARVAAAVGIPEGALEEVSVSFHSFETAVLPDEPSAGEIRAEALLGRADVRKSLAEYAAAESALRLEVARQYPDIHLGPGYKWNQGENHFIFGFSAELPIFNRNRGPIVEAEARRKEAEVGFSALQARVVGEADRAVAVYASSRREAETAEVLADRSGKNVDRVRAAFDAGELDRVALRTAEIELTTAARSRLDAILEVQKAAGLLDDVVQRPLTAGPLPAPSETSARPEKETP
ncbi:MAG: TolC family protein [Acidobacteriota bacterium]|nr:TolC family protein [Acidobacteriota bacterium]